MELRRCRLRREAERYALVLAAVGIGSRLVPQDGAVALLVPPADAERARYEINQYVKENWRPRPAPLAVRSMAEGTTGVLAYCTVLIFLYAASTQRALAHDWLAAGMAQAGRIAEGEWWRTITALGLHGDFGHLFGNLIVGSLFGLLLAQLLGNGLAWLAILLAGTAGNLLNALLQPVSHSSIGASTAVFAALGLLSALTWRRHANIHAAGLRRWLPLAAGIMLLGYLGIGGERTDLGAHLAGFAAGIGGGAAIAAAGSRIPKGPAAQMTFATVALLLPLLAWVIALNVQGQSSS